MSISFWSWPTAIWLLFWLVWPMLRRWLGQWLQARAEISSFWYSELEPWLYGLVPPYAAWLLGWLPGRLLGFNGRGGPVGWLMVGLVLLGLLLVYWRWLLPKLSIGKLEFRRDHALLDEPRWALYRGVGWLWLWNFWWGMLLGLLLAVIEWSLIHQVWRAERRQDELVCFDLARRAASSLAFTLSGNLWLTMIFQVGLLWPLDERSRALDEANG